jgi:hypothetical protein
MLKLISEFEFFQTNNIEPIYLGEENGRCLFCNHPYSPEKFKKKAHAVPEFLGNKNIFFYNECDSCNKHFGDTIERHFDNFLGIKKTFFKCRGKNGVSTTVLDKTDHPKQFVEFNPTFNILQISLSPDTELVTLNEETCESVIRHKKKPYNPTWVYKFLVKMALSIMPKDNVREYINLANYVITGDEIPYPITFDVDEHNNPTHILAIPDLLIYDEMSFSGKIPFPNSKVFLFQKNESDMEYYIFSFCIGNYCLQIPLFSYSSLYKIRYNTLKNSKFKYEISFPALSDLKLDDSLLSVSSHAIKSLANNEIVKEESDDLFFSNIKIIKLDETQLQIQDPKKRKISGKLIPKT